MITNNVGLSLKTERIITKDDIITMCNLLNTKSEYFNLCEFMPEGITEGGIIFKFNDNFDKNWYKSVRLRVNSGLTRGKWYWINENVMSEWKSNNDIIFDKNTKFTTFIKSFRGAPLFTIDELRIWEECFNKIGIVRVGKYPSKKSLIDKN
jgi:pantothenate kinase